MMIVLVVVQVMVMVEVVAMVVRWCDVWLMSLVGWDRINYWSDCDR